MITSETLKEALEKENRFCVGDVPHRKNELFIIVPAFDEQTNPVIIKVCEKDGKYIICDFNRSWSYVSGLTRMDKKDIISNVTKRYVLRYNRKYGIYAETDNEIAVPDYICYVAKVSIIANYELTRAAEYRKAVLEAK